MTTLAELVEQTPGAARGQPVQIDYGDGQWRHVLELADPAAGTAVVWYDITQFWCGLEYTRGADAYLGRYRSSVANIELCTDSDALAPWNGDTSATFGTHVELGPGLLIRSALIRVSGGVVVDWNPRFTLKVESWGDASYSRGAIRRHQIVARDLFTSFVTLPLPASDEENWSDRMFRWLTDTDWPYGSLIYGAQFTDPGGVPILLLPARPATTSAINELDASLDPAGLVWYTDRYGHLVVRPRVDDTFHADAFTAGATGDEYPGPFAPVTFTWFACSEPAGSSDLASYAQDNSIDPFGLDKTERWVINHVRVTDPVGVFDDDDPISIQRYDRKTMQVSWIAENDVVAAQILETRAYATVEARPLFTALGLPGFHPGPAVVDYLDPVTIQHRNNDSGLSTYANSWLRQYREQMAPRGCELDWSLTLITDVWDIASDAGLLPVEDLAVVDTTETTAEFSWSNPAQAITPTNTQIRIVDAGSLWAATGYPITGATWSGLSPGTAYTFQVRLIRIVDGLITHVSPMRQITFVTDAASVPVFDDGTVTFPDPGACDEIDWELQESDDGETWSTVDSGTLTDPPWEIDLSGFLFNPAKLYRIESDACGEITYSELFVGDCSEPAILGDAPYDDADLEAYWPAICPPDIVVEAITEQFASHGPSYDGFTSDGAGSAVLIADGDGIVVHGLTPTAVEVLTTDTTIACRVLLMTQPDAPVTLFQCAGLTITAIAEDANWTVSAKCWEEVGGFTTISTSTELDFGAWYDVAVVHDVAAGDLFLYVDGVEEASALGTVGYRHNPDYFEIGASDNGLITNCAIWSRVLDPSELPGYSVPLTVTINQKAGQSDPAFAQPVLFEAVFSAAVTGFTAADVTLSGTAGATTVNVSTSDNITFEVQVTSMANGNGTVIATIAAGVCNAAVGGTLNDASTSIDNTVTYNSPAFFVHGTRTSGGILAVQVGDLVVWACNRRDTTVPGYGLGVSHTATLGTVTTLVNSVQYDTMGASSAAFSGWCATVTAAGNCQITTGWSSSSHIVGVYRRVGGLARIQHNAAGGNGGSAANVNFSSTPNYGCVAVLAVAGTAGSYTDADVTPEAAWGTSDVVLSGSSNVHMWIYSSATPVAGFNATLNNAGMTSAGGRYVMIVEAN